MSAQTPQTDNKAYTPFEDDANPQVVNAEFARTLEAERDHYKALCEELRIDIESWQAEIVTIIARLPAHIARNLQARLDKSRAALKKAEKDI
jgi:hypothetical protein